MNIAILTSIRDAYLFDTGQQPRQGGMGNIWRGYRLSDIRIAVSEGRLNLRVLPDLNQLQPNQLVALRELSRQLNFNQAIEEFRQIDNFGGIRKIAIKVLRKELAKSPSNVERFDRESEVKIRHKNVVEILDDVIRVPSQNYAKHHIIMEYVEGTSLDRLLEKQPEGRLQTQEALHIIRQVLEGLDAIHSEHGWFHRDIKASNVLLAHDGNVKITDFGVAKPDPSDSSHAQLTGIATFVGTLNYASPEQVRMLNLQVGRHTDIWQTGVMLYLMVSGRLPFKGENDDQTRMNILENSAPDIPDLDPRLMKILHKALEKDIRNRYLNAESFITDIDNIVEYKKNDPLLPTKSYNIGAIFSIGLTILILAFFYFISKCN